MERSASQPLVLASASPRRLELVSLLGIPFEVIPSRAEENDVTGSGKERVRVLARRKGEEVAARLPGRTVLAADTLVCVENEVLGKPVDEADAARMIRLLSGRSHWVYTGVCLLLPDGTVRESAAQRSASPSWTKTRSCVTPPPASRWIRPVPMRCRAGRVRSSAPFTAAPPT